MTGIFNNKEEKVSKRTEDTWTGRVYGGRNQAYLDLTTTYGLPIDKTLGWYDLCRKFPFRFRDIATGKLIKASGRLV